MNWNQIRQLFERIRGGRDTEAPRRFAHALKLLLASRSASRRPMVDTVSQVQILEIRQVLSVVNPVAVPNGALDSTSESSADASQLNGETESSTNASVALPLLDSVVSDQSEMYPWESPDSSSDSERNPFFMSRLPAADTQDAGLTAIPVNSVSAISISETGLTNSHDSALSLIDTLVRGSEQILAGSLSTTLTGNSGKSDLVRASNTSPQASDFELPRIVDPDLTKGHLETASTTSTGFGVPVSHLTSNAASNPGGNWRWQSIAATAFEIQWQRETLHAESHYIPNQSFIEAGNADSSQNTVLGGSVLDDAFPGWRAAFTEIDGFFADVELFTWPMISVTVTDGTSQSALSFAPGETLPVAVPRLASDAVRQPSLSNVPGATQLQVKQLREGNRLYFHTEVDSADFVQFETSPDLHADEDIPRELKYTALPRGPPRKQPDTVLRIMDSDADAKVLQRLRYSIAPRGPSSVTVEMPSPEECLFSGPRVSPVETCHMRLAC